MSNSILSDRRILKRGLHYETVIQSSKSPMITFLANKKTTASQLYHAGNGLLTPKASSCPLLVVVLSTKADLNERSRPPKRWRADIITTLTSLTSF